MENTKFITINTLTGNRMINLDAISSIESLLGGTKIILKEVKDGNNVELISSSNFRQITGLIASLMEPNSYINARHEEMPVVTFLHSEA